MAIIYTLSDPDSSVVRYVGKTNNIKERLRQHIYRSNRKKTHLDCWINSVLEGGNKPIIMEIDNCCDDEWEFWEKYWISQFKTWCFNLVNAAEGGMTAFPLYKKVVSPKQHPDSVSVLKYSLDGYFMAEYPSISQAARCVGRSPASLSEACRRRGSSAGFQWMFSFIDYPMVIDKYKHKLNPTVFKKGHKLNVGMKIGDEAKIKMSLAKKIPLIDIKDGTIFMSLKEAADHYGIPRGTLGSMFFSNRGRSPVMYLDESKNKPTIKNKTNVAIIDSHTGITYQSISEAIRSIPISSYIINSKLNNGDRFFRHEKQTTL
jgi:hypothetical protein